MKSDLDIKLKSYTKFTGNSHKNNKWKDKYQQILTRVTP